MIDKEKLMKLSIEDLNALIKQVQEMIMKKQIEILEKEKQIEKLQNEN